MAFQIVNTNGSSDNFSDQDRYTFNAQGLLVVHHADGVRRTYGPSGWAYIEERPSAVSSRGGK